MFLYLSPNVKRFVDDTFVIQLREHKENLPKCINNIDSAIKFTVEDI